MRKIILALVALGICMFTSYAFADGIDAYTVLLIHGNGADGSTSFFDDSYSNHPVTANGNAQVDTAHKKFGTGSILFDGDGDYLSVPDSVDWDLGAGDFTIDFWIRFNSFSQMGGIFSQSLGGSEEAGFYTYLHQPYSVLYFRWRATDGTMVSYGYTWESAFINTWYHIAFVRNGSNIHLFIDGVDVHPREDVAIGSKTLRDADDSLLIGGNSYNGYFDGWLDEFRISKGIARWTSDFTPPTEEYATFPNDPPIADAGPDLTANAGEEVTLDGSYSHDYDGDIISWVWRSLSDPQNPTVAEGEVATMVAHGYVEELIELTVTDNAAATATDTMTITNTIVEDAKEIPELQDEITQLQNQLQSQQEVINKLKQFPALENWMKRNE